MKQNELDQYSEIIIGLLNKSSVKINKWREKFMLEVLLLYLIIPGRINFLQLGRYGRFGEQRYREQFSHKFDWLSFNANLAESQFGNRVAKHQNLKIVLVPPVIIIGTLAGSALISLVLSGKSLADCYRTRIGVLIVYTSLQEIFLLI